jgi:hypothetical protein
MPMLILSVSVDFNELFEDGRGAAIAVLSKLRRVVVVTVYSFVVLVIAILGPKYSFAH